MPGRTLTDWGARINRIVSLLPEVRAGTLVRAEKFAPGSYVSRMATVYPRRIIDPRIGDAAVGAGASAVLAVDAVGVLSEGVRFGAEVAVFSCGIAALVCLFLFWKPSNTYRGLGIYLWTGLAATIASGSWAVTGSVVPWLWCVVLLGSVIGVFAAFHYARTSRRAGAVLWNPMRPVPPVTTVAAGLTLALLASVLGYSGLTIREAWPVAAQDERVRFSSFAFAVSLTLFAVLRLFRPAFEWFFVPTFGGMYFIRGTGPGFARVPPVGPVLLIGNHGGYFDPVILQKVTDRPVTGMMTSVYYDLWFVKLLSILIFRTIRVPHATARHEAPELREAVAALDRGECVMIFPEGWLRRKEDVPLKRFGQGIWQILRDRPDTPVVCCWIEGTWGSLFSFKNGPPMKGKSLDFWRPVDVGINAPILVPADVLADHWETRFFLMNEVSAARSHLGLEPLPRFERSGHDADE
jgi:1-acyl-sn-glycerol-3-phosphate acyltransferase